MANEILKLLMVAFVVLVSFSTCSRFWRSLRCRDFSGFRPDPYARGCTVEFWWSTGQLSPRHGDLWWNHAHFALDWALGESRSWTCFREQQAASLDSGSDAVDSLSVEWMPLLTFPHHWRWRLWFSLQCWLTKHQQASLLALSSVAEVFQEYLPGDYSSYSWSCFRSVLC